MASRKQQKARAREQRAVTHQPQRRRQRGWFAAGALIVAVVMVAASIAASSSTKSPGAHLGDPGVAKKVAAELSGIPQSGNLLGNPAAKVTIAYYGDLECSHCQAFTLQDLPTLINDEIRTGKARLVYHSLETASQYNPDPNAFKTQQIAASAAGLQNHAWDYIELFYNQQGPEGTGYVTESYLDELAKQIPGFNYATWLTDRNAPNLPGFLQADATTAQSYGLNSTPSFYVSGPKGTPQTISDAVSASTIEAAVSAVS